MLYHKTSLALLLVLIMAGCTQPTPDPVPPPVPPEPAPTPTPEPDDSTIIIEGPTAIPPNYTATLHIKGVTPEQLQSGKVVWWPRDNIEVLPVQTWGGQPLLMVRSPVDNTYLVQVMTAINNELIYAEHTLKIGNIPEPTPPGPTPDPEPGPEPAPDPEPEPIPDFEEPLTLLLIEETGDRTTDEAAAVLSQDIINFIKSKEWDRYLLDQDIKDKDGKTPASVKPYIDRAVGKGLPWYIIVDKNGKVITEDTITTEEALLKVLREL